MEAEQRMADKEKLRVGAFGSVLKMEGEEAPKAGGTFGAGMKLAHVLKEKTKTRKRPTRHNPTDPPAETDKQREMREKFAARKAEEDAKREKIRAENNKRYSNTVQTAEDNDDTMATGLSNSHLPATRLVTCWHGALSISVINN